MIRKFNYKKIMILQRTWDATDKLVDEETRSGRPVDKSLWGWFKAISYMVIGFVVLAVLAEPLIDNVQDFSTAAGIPSFFVAFVLVPLATNARQAASAISAASRQTPRTTDLTFSEVISLLHMLLFTLSVCRSALLNIAWHTLPRLKCLHCHI